jgi:hypothetical protein
MVPVTRRAAKRLFLGSTGVQKSYRSHNEVVTAQMSIAMEAFLDGVQVEWSGVRLHMNPELDARIRAALASHRGIHATMQGAIDEERSDEGVAHTSNAARTAIDALRTIGASSSDIIEAGDSLMRDGVIPVWSRVALVHELLPHMVVGPGSPAPETLQVLPMGRAIAWSGDRGEVQLPTDDPGETHDIPTELVYVRHPTCVHVGYWSSTLNAGVAFIMIGDLNTGMVHVCSLSPTVTIVSCAPSSLNRVLAAMFTGAS